jgi:hypothetical protein
MKIKLVVLNALFVIAFSFMIYFLYEGYFEKKATLAQVSTDFLLTKWEKAGASLSELLDNGWQISGHSSSHAAFRVANDDAYNKKGYTFLLTKSNKYIMCFIENPLPPAARTICRKLN